MHPGYLDFRKLCERMNRGKAAAAGGDKEGFSLSFGAVIQATPNYREEPLMWMIIPSLEVVVQALAPAS